MHQVFISYSSADHDVAMRLASVVRSAGFTPWVYEFDSLPGVPYLDQVHAAIHVSDAIALLISAHALRSQQVSKELILAHEFGKPCIPILVELTHSDLQHKKPDWRLALGASVSIRIPPEGLETIAPQILAGLRALISNASRNQHLETSPTIESVKPVDPPPPQDDWASLSARIQSFPAEVQQLRNRFSRHWKQLSQPSDLRVDVRSLTVERVRLADRFIKELVDVVDQQWAPVPDGCALIARGGFGRGVLSLGSDIDVTLLHDKTNTREAESFQAPFVRGLTDVCNAVEGLTAAPIISTIDECKRNWESAIRDAPERDLSAIASFAFSRQLFGRNSLHEELRTAWRDFVRDMPKDHLEKVVGYLHAHVEQKAIPPEFLKFDLKADAGGILDCRLIGFIEQLLITRGEEAGNGDFGIAEAHQFLLWLRDNLYAAKKTHDITPFNARSLAQSWIGAKEPGAHADDFIAEVTRCRRRIRSGLLRSLGSLEKSLNAV